MSKGNRLILRSKHPKNWQHKGGWRYSLMREMQTSPLLSGNSAFVQQKTQDYSTWAAIKDAVDYLSALQIKLRRQGNPVDKKSGLPINLAELQNSRCVRRDASDEVCGEYESPFVHGAIWLLEHPPAKHNKSFTGTTNSQGMYQREANTPGCQKLTEDLLLNLQAREALGRALVEGGQEGLQYGYGVNALQSNTTTFPSTKDKEDWYN